MLTPLPAAASLHDGRDRADPEDLGVELRRLREVVGLSQLEVAYLCQVDVSTISRWERGRHQHTHRSKDRAIRLALQALRWAARLQASDPQRVFTLEEIAAEVRLRLQQQRRSRRA
jgi:transcriptional regulator with XRE-family HTH domain